MSSFLKVVSFDPLVIENTGDAGAPGVDGTNIVSAHIDGSNHLILVLSTGTNVDAGDITSPITAGLTANFVLRSLAPVYLDAATYDGNDAAQNTLFASLSAGRAVEIPAGVTISRGSNFAPSRKIHIQGLGTFLDTRTSPSGAFITIGPAAAGSTVSCRLAGSVAGSYVVNHHAVLIQGTDNGAATPPTFVSQIGIRSPEITGFGSTAIRGEFIQNCTVDIAEVHHNGYAGSITSSALDTSVRFRLLHDLAPGTSGNSYGIQFDRRDATSDLVRYPHSKNCYGFIDVARNVINWDALGTHGGQGIFLGYGSLYGVKRPIDIVAATGDGGTAAFAPNNVVFSCGYAESGVTDGTMGPAINVAGAFKVGIDVLGTPTEHAKGVNGSIGELVGYGLEGDSTQGAIYLHSTQDLVLDAGIAREASPYAVALYHDNKDFVLKGVTAIDPWSNSVATAGIVSVISTFNNGWIVQAAGSAGSKSASTAWAATTAVTYNQLRTKGGYVYKAVVAGTTGSTGPVGTVLGVAETDGTVTWVNVNTTATHVNNRGLSILVDATNVINLGTAADFSSASTPIVGLSQCRWGAFGTLAAQPAGTTDLLVGMKSLGLIASGAAATPLSLGGGALTAGAVTASGHIVVSQGAGNPPLALALTNAGTSAPTPLFDAIPADNRCSVQMGTGGSPAAGDQARITFKTAFSAVPVITVTALNAATAALQPYVSSITANNFIIAFLNAPAASQAVNTYRVAAVIYG